ncbi:MAG: hypothetical protein R2710_20405 [Acidimicrobiales bacterium]
MRSIFPTTAWRSVPRRTGGEAAVTASAFRWQRLLFATAALAGCIDRLAANRAKRRP